MSPHLTLASDGNYFWRGGYKECSGLEYCQR